MALSCHDDATMVTPNLSVVTRSDPYKCACTHTTDWLPWLQTKLRNSGHEMFALLLKTNCIR